MGLHWRETHQGISSRIEDEIEDLFEQGKRGYKDLNSEERALLTGLLMRTNRKESRQEAIQSLNEIFDSLSLYLSSNKESQKSHKAAIIKLLKKDMADHYKPHIDELFESRRQYELDRSLDEQYYRDQDDAYDLYSLREERNAA